MRVIQNLVVTFAMHFILLLTLYITTHTMGLPTHKRLDPLGLPRELAHVTYDGQEKIENYIREHFKPPKIDLSYAKEAIPFEELSKILGIFEKRIEEIETRLVEDGLFEDDIAQVLAHTPLGIQLASFFRYAIRLVDWHFGLIDLGKPQSSSFIKAMTQVFGLDEDAKKKSYQEFEDYLKRLWSVSLKLVYFRGSRDKTYALQLWQTDAFQSIVKSLKISELYSSWAWADPHIRKILLDRNSHDPAKEATTSYHRFTLSDTTLDQGQVYSESEGRKSVPYVPKKYIPEIKKDQPRFLDDFYEPSMKSVQDLNRRINEHFGPPRNLKPVRIQ